MGIDEIKERLLNRNEINFIIDDESGVTKMRSSSVTMNVEGLPLMDVILLIFNPDGTTERLPVNYFKEDENGTPSAVELTEVKRSTSIVLNKFSLNKKKLKKTDTYRN